MNQHKIRDLDILKDFNLLFIEDDEVALQSGVELLSDFLNNVFAAGDSKQALDIIKHNKVDIIVSDILLKDENSLDFFIILRQDYHIHTPIILTTAYMDTEFLLKSIKIKVENYLVKPVNMKELLNSIHDTLLPLTQDKEIKKSYNIIKSISMICDNKHIEVIRFIINNLDNNNIFNYSYQEIMEKIDISKPTLVKLFRILIEKGILTKLQRSKYLFNEDRLNHINMERKK